MRSREGNDSRSGCTPKNTDRTRRDIGDRTVGNVPVVCHAGLLIHCIGGRTVCTNRARAGNGRCRLEAYINRTWSESGGQPELPVVIKLRLTTPALISLADGV
jgi:hypothetical protein